MISSFFTALLTTALFLSKAHGHPPAPPGSSIKRSVGTWEYRGCYVDFGPRILNFRFDVPEGNTAERCTQLCADHGYGIAGLEYGTECWCDNYNIYGELPIVDESKCNYACPGDETEWCGSANRQLVYVNSAATPPSPNLCIDWRIWHQYSNSRLQAISKTGTGTPRNLYAMPFSIPGDSNNYRLMTTCPTSGSCPYSDYFNFSLWDNILRPYEARAVAPSIGGSQSFISTWPVTFTGHAGYCPKPNPISPHGPFVGFPLLSVNGDVDSWALCPNNTAGGRLDVVYRPIPGHPQYDRASCNDVYIQMLPYIIDYSNYGPQP